MGEAQEAGVADEAQSPLGDLFFPKPFNKEQVEIVRRLEKTDGVVVQGPPGTGKTHTISNIICHYLATGRRVLVVSHGEAALSVLKDKLPEQVRDLAISITTSEREGLKQLEGAIRLLQDIVQKIQQGDQTRKIRDIERSIIGMRQRIVEIDNLIESAARAQLSEVKGRGILPAQLATAVVAKRDLCNWFKDRPRLFLSETTIRITDIDNLRHARVTLGKRIENLDAVLPSVDDLPTGARLAQVHSDIVRGDQHAADAHSDPDFAPRIASLEGIAVAEKAADALETLVRSAHHFNLHPWLREFATFELAPQYEALTPAIESLIEEGLEILEEHKIYVQQPVLIPETAFNSTEFISIISKLGEGQSAFGMFAFSERKLRPLVDEVRIVGRKPSSPTEWKRICAFVQWRVRVIELNTRWAAIATNLGLESSHPLSLRDLSNLIVALKAIVVTAPDTMRSLQDCLPKVLTKAPSTLWPDIDRMTRLADCLRNAAASTRLSASRVELSRVLSLFGEKSGKIGTLAKAFLNDAVGRTGAAPNRIEAAWNSLLSAIEDLTQNRSHLLCIRDVTRRLEDEGAPVWARRLRQQQALESNDPEIPSNWAESWDWAASENYLGTIDQREAVRALADERASLDEAVSKEFERLVRERTFYALAQNMTGPIRAALMMFATALRRIGGGTGAGAARHRRAARQAMAQCYSGVPCWIMPSWRVAEQLPGEVGTFDLVIMDEASQSDIKEFTTLLRGKKVLVVGDDKQVSPTAAFIENAKIDRLEKTYLAKQPFKTLLLPGASLYDLAKVMFPDKFIMLREHFRCVEPIIQFSKQFYTEELVPLRIPTAQERLDPPLIDIFVPDGRRSGDKINHREAEVIIDEIRRIIETPSLATNGTANGWRTIGVISLIGSKQAALINRMALDAFGEELMVRHKIACGDSATFQGNERDLLPNLPPFISRLCSSFAPHRSVLRTQLV